MQKVGELVADTFELSANKKNQMPLRLELTESEEAFYEVVKKLRTIEANVRTQKQELRNHYSATDRYDYKELLKEKNRLSNQLKRMAKKENKNVYDIEFYIDIKKTYNRYVPKITKTTNKAELKDAEELIMNNVFYMRTKELLLQLIEQHKKTLKK